MLREGLFEEAALRVRLEDERQIQKKQCARQRDSSMCEGPGYFRKLMRMESEEKSGRRDQKVSQKPDYPRLHVHGKESECYSTSKRKVYAPSWSISVQFACL